MGKIESYAPGSFCWAELATNDTAAAKRFYGEMFGWAAVDLPMPEGAYTLLKSGGDDAAALCPTQPGVPVHWGVYFSVASADQSAAQVAPGGGKLIAGPFDVMDVGRMAVCQDPQGATFSLWQAGRHIGATYGGPLNRVSWPELATTDPAGAAGFYTRLFGWKTKPETGVETAEYTEWVNGQASIGGMLPMRGGQWQGVPPHWMVYITVADCDERTAKAGHLGAKVCVPPMDIKNVGRFSVMADPQGAMFAIIRLAAAYQPATA